MAIKNLTILGFSEGTLTMLFDVLNSKEIYPQIEILNNLGVQPKKDYEHPKFNIMICEDSDLSKKDVVLGVTTPKIKKKIIDEFNIDKLSYPLNLISEESSISHTTKLGKGITINALTCIAGQSKIGDYVYINRNVSVGHHTEIGNYTTINPGVNIAGNIKIGEGCLIGMGVNIIDGITIGKNTIIGAGSLVTKDIPDNVVAYGSPCKIIRNND